MSTNLLEYKTYIYFDDMVEEVSRVLDIPKIFTESIIKRYIADGLLKSEYSFPGWWVYYKSRAIRLVKKNIEEIDTI